MGIWNLGEPDPALFQSEDERLKELLQSVPESVENGSSEIPKDGRKITMIVDITMSLESILQDVTRRVDFAKRRYEALVGQLPNYRRQPRKRMDQYANYLHVWQLRKEKGWTFEKISRALFPNEMEGADRYSPTVKRVRAQYQRACELIAGAYRQIGT